MNKIDQPDCLETEEAERLENVTAAAHPAPFSWESVRVPLAFLTVLLIWSTTPLAIAKSVGGVPFTSALLRMSIGATFCVLVLMLRSHLLPLTSTTKRLYLISGGSIFGSMSLIYTAAQTIPSGWIAVLFGLSPIITGLFALPFEPESKLTPVKVAGLLLGFTGLYLVFSAGISFEAMASMGIVYVFLAVLIASASSVAMRHISINVEISGMQLTTGGLLVAIPLFMTLAFFTESLDDMAYGATEITAALYLGLIGTGIGFTVYFFLLKRMSASRVALITLITPISSLALGAQLNNEPLLPGIWVGAVCVSIGLLLYEFKPRLGFRKL